MRTYCSSERAIVVRPRCIKGFVCREEELGDGNFGFHVSLCLLWMSRVAAVGKTAVTVSCCESPQIAADDLKVDGTEDDMCRKAWPINRPPKDYGGL